MTTSFISGRFFRQVALLGLIVLFSSPGARGDDAANSSIWSHDNLYAWCVVPFDAKKRNSEDRAQMLQDLGFKQFVYDWRGNNIPTFDAEIEALQKHNVALLGWWSPTDAHDPTAKIILQAFRRHNIHPQLWVMGGGPLTKSPEEQQQRIKQEADRIKALVKLAAPYGTQVELYNHNGWFGQEDNQLALLDRLKELGVTDVGMVYNFSHARDNLHDDTANFPEIWKKIESHVVAVNVTGIGPSGNELYPGQGAHDLDMMRTIQDSGWKGPVGLIAEKGGDAAITLKNNLLGLDWAAAELKQPGSGGPPPFPLIPDPHPQAAGQ
jgi:sugar phosphate isomerase/epimerase